MSSDYFFQRVPEVFGFAHFIEIRKAEPDSAVIARAELLVRERGTVEPRSRADTVPVKPVGEFMAGKAVDVEQQSVSFAGAVTVKSNALC